MTERTSKNSPHHKIIKIDGVDKKYQNQNVEKSGNSPKTFSNQAALRQEEWLNLSKRFKK